MRQKVDKDPMSFMDIGNIKVNTIEELLEILDTKLAEWQRLPRDVKTAREYADYFSNLLWTNEQFMSKDLIFPSDNPERLRISQELLQLAGLLSL
jgi:hypothetical protein